MKTRSQRRRTPRAPLPLRPDLDERTDGLERLVALAARLDDQRATFDDPVDDLCHDLDPPADRTSSAQADGADTGHGARARHPALLVGVEDHGHGGTLLVRPLDGHPGDELVGTTLPASWWAAGIVAHGTARVLRDDGPRLRADRRDPGRPVRHLQLVNRDGAAVAIARVGDDEPVVVVQDGDDRQALGYLDDCLRRALGLPTAPPPASTVAVWAALWLEAVLAAVVGREVDGADWAAIAALHPALATATAPAPRHGRSVPGAPHGAADLAVAVDAHVAAHGWDRLLAAERAGDGVGAIPLDVARWMDEGIYAREVLGALLDPGPALADLELALAPHVHALVVAHLVRWGLVPPWPGLTEGT